MRAYLFISISSTLATSQLFIVIIYWEDGERIGVQFHLLGGVKQCLCNNSKTRSTDAMDKTTKEAEFGSKYRDGGDENNGARVPSTGRARKGLLMSRQFGVEWLKTV